MKQGHTGFGWKGELYVADGVESRDQAVVVVSYCSGLTGCWCRSVNDLIGRRYDVDDCSEAEGLDERRFC